jgi:hypothetical protein
MSRWKGSVAKNFKLIRNKHILKSFRVKRVERVLLFFCKIYSRRYYTLYFDELKIFCNTTVSLATLLGPAIALGMLVLLACLSVPLYYEITSTSVIVRSGVLRWTIPLTSIQRVFPTRNPVNGPALSLDRLQVDYVTGGIRRFILISPKTSSASCLISPRGEWI